MPSRYDILFEPVKIGPVIAPNRFYQVPHCNGFGWRMPQGHAAMRGVKAEGGWGVVHTEEVEVHHTTDLSPYFEGRLWNDDDIPALQLMTEAVHKYGAPAGIELAYNRHDASNLYSRAAPFDLRSRGIVGASGYEPGQSRAANKDDIKQIRKWHRNAAIRAKRAGFDIITCYAAHNLSLAFHFLSKENERADEYGGSLENRVRFLRELIEDTKEAVGDTLSRTVITSLCTWSSVFAHYMFGGPVLEPFSFVLLIGLIAGSYSTIYVAAPTLTFWLRLFGGKALEKDKGGGPRPVPAAKKPGNARA